MIPVSYYNPEEFTSPKFAYAFAKGCGGTITDDPELFPGPVALFGSPSRWPTLRAAQAAGRDWYYGDHAYLGKGKYYRITKNAYQHDGRGSATTTRFKMFRRYVQPWKTNGTHIVVCPNSAVHFALHGLDVNVWLAETIATIKQHSDRPIIVRWKVDRAIQPIERDLEHAWAVVVFSSAASLDALIAGVPIFTTAPWAASYRMGLSDLTQIEAPLYPGGREGFLSNLVSNQWTLQEILRGDAWRALQGVESRAA